MLKILNKLCLLLDVKGMKNRTLRILSIVKTNRKNNEKRAEGKLKTKDFFLHFISASTFIKR